LVALAQDRPLTLALARSAITPGEETFTYAVPKQLGWFKRQGLSVSLLKANGSTAALQAVASGSADVAYASSLNIAGMFGVLMVLAATGMLMHGAVSWLRRHLLFWSERHDRSHDS
jgi:ABC-type nitrate/sulfonate/bicarbonate transport system substrate-binding protein